MIVKAIKRGTYLGNEFKRGIHLVFCTDDRIAVLQPREILGSRSKRITTGTTERMPIGDSKPEVFFHRLLANFLLGIIVFKRQWIVRCLAFESDLTYALEEFLVSQRQF